jgi:hypothetical protein
MKHRGIRRHQTRYLILKRVGAFSKAVDMDFYELMKEKNRFAKRSPFDCGVPQCPGCHPYKADPTGNYHLRKADRQNRIEDAEWNDALAG